MTHRLQVAGNCPAQGTFGCISAVAECFSVVCCYRLEDLAAAIEASAGQQATTIDFQCMSQHTPEILQLLYEMLTQPALPQDKLDVVKAQARNAIEHRDDNASSVARRWVQGTRLQGFFFNALSARAAASNIVQLHTGPTIPSNNLPELLQHDYLGLWELLGKIGSTSLAVSCRWAASCTNL